MAETTPNPNETAETGEQLDPAPAGFPCWENSRSSSWSRW